MSGLAAWLLNPPPIDVSIDAEPYSFPRYDDHAGNLPLGAVVKVTNLSKSTVWVLGLPGSPTFADQQLVDGEWTSSMSFSTSDPKQWTPLRPMESLTILAGPISERATELRVGLSFTTERLAPTEAHWVYSPAVKIVKRGQDYFPEPKPGAQQEEQILPLN
ncbi:MAG TPA: hypothetical protein VMV59_04240 [Candidatus Dormibacteraeota bacterium]|nr:hypothetical protein [Candidatus Dormibacteraeota bacterium]